MIMRATPQALPAFYQLRQMFHVEHPREGTIPAEQLIVQGRHTVIFSDAGGYCLFHLQDFGGQTVLWVDELYLQPNVRKQGHLREFTDWLRNYCQYNGIPALMGMAYSLEEALPFKKHLQAEPVAQILRVPVERAFYHPTEQVKPELPLNLPASFIEKGSGDGRLAPVGMQPKPVKRGRKGKPKIERIYSSEELAEMTDGVESQVKARHVQIQQEMNGSTITHKSGVVMPLPADPGRM